MDKKYHRGSGEVVKVKNKPNPDLVTFGNYEVYIDKCKAWEQNLVSIPIYAYCDPSHPVGWIEGEEVYQVGGCNDDKWWPVPKWRYDVKKDNNKRIWIDTERVFSLKNGIDNIFYILDKCAALLTRLEDYVHDGFDDEEILSLRESIQQILSEIK